DGMGFKLIYRILKEEGVPPLTNKGWSRTTMRRIIGDRQALGEYQPTCGGKPEGEVILNFFPQVIDPVTFSRAQVALTQRKKKTAAVTSFVDFLFSGLVKDARDGSSYFAQKRVEKKSKNGVANKHHVIQSAGPDAASFPLQLFEKAILHQLQEVNPKE